MAIGGAAVEIVPDARDFWRRFQEQTRGGALKAGEDGGRQYMRGFRAETDRGADVKVRADTKAARAEIAALRNDVNRGSGDMIKNLLALSPALVPLSAATAAAGAEFVALGATGILAITGIKREIEAATPVGLAYGSIVNNLQGSLHKLQATASAGALSGLGDAQAKLAAHLPEVNRAIAQQSVLLGSVASHLVGGIVGGFKNFAPLLDQVSGSVERISEKFEKFATGPGGAEFAKTLSRDYAIVAPAVNNIAEAISHVVQAAHGIGVGLVSTFGLLANVVSSFPLPVLEGIVDAFVVLRTASAINGVVTTVSASLTALSARVSLSALEQTAASAAIEAAAASEAVTVAQSRASEAAAIAASQAEIAASLAGTGSLFEAEAVAAAAASAEIAVSLQAAATAAVASSEEIGAAAAAAAAEVRAAGAAAATAGTGFAAALGPIGLLAGGALLLSTYLSGADDSTRDATSAVQSFTSALADSNGVLNDSVRAAAAKQLSDSGIGDILNKAGFSIADATKNLTRAKDEATKLGPALLKANDAGKITNREWAHANTVLVKLRDAYLDAAESARAQAAALLGVGTTSDNAAQALSDGNTAVRAYVAALDEFNRSADTAADRGKLIGEVLRASNGDVLSFQSSVVKTAQANQQLVTDFVNLKDGVLNLKTGTLDYHNAAAAPLINDLTQLQDASVKAAAAVYQHEVSTRGGKAAAQDAFEFYKNQTRGALLDQAEQLGLTSRQARRLADQYFGIKNSGDLKKQIALIGQDKVVNALERIATDLELLVNKLFTVTLDIDLSAFEAKLQQANGDLVTIGANGSVTSRSAPGGRTGLASGGGAPEGLFAVGEQGPEIVSKRGSRVDVMSNAQSKRFIAATGFRFPGFAGGTGETGGFSGVDYSTGVVGAKASARASTVKKAHVTYVVDGQDYSTLKEAKKAAEEAFNVRVSLGLTIDTHDLNSFRKALSGTASEAHEAFSKLYDDAKELGISNGLARTLRDENTILDRAVSERNRTANRLKATQDRFAQIRADVKASITGSFDVTSAGTGFDGNQAVTGRNILAQSKQQENRVKLFVKDIKALAGKVNGTYLKQLALAGPDALPQVQALMQLNKTQLGQLNASRASISAQGDSLGTGLGGFFYGKDINTYKDQLRNQTQTVTKLGEILADQVTDAVEAIAKRPVIVKANGREIARVVNEENKQLARLR